MWPPPASVIVCGGAGVVGRAGKLNIMSPELGVPGTRGKLNIMSQ